MKRTKQIKIAMAALLAAFVLLLICPLKFSLGQTHFSKRIQIGDTVSAIYPQGFNHVQWDAPTGETGSGEYWTFRVGNSLIQFDIWTGSL